MSSTVPRDDGKEIARLKAQIDNITRRHCKIGKVVEKTLVRCYVIPPVSYRYRPQETFFVPPYEPIVT